MAKVVRLEADIAQIQDPYQMVRDLDLELKKDYPDLRLEKAGYERKEMVIGGRVNVRWSCWVEGRGK
jgi:hypothetical protein